MLSREAFIKDRDYVFNKVYGALAGIAIGDSFGDAARMQENRANYQVTTDFNKGASWSTDDTEFALLTAHTIIRCGGKLTTEECVKSWMEHVVTQDEYKRGGASEVEAAKNLRRGILPPESGKFNTYHQSDGSAMRIGPIGILCAGDIEKANDLLGRNYFIEGTVIHGNALGRTLNMPTANIVPDKSKLLLPSGVYASKVKIEGDSQVYKGVTNVGRKPTIGRYDIGVETCLLDFDRDIYGKKITVEFYEHIRHEKKFPGLDELKNQMEKDKERARHILKK